MNFYDDDKILVSLGHLNLEAYVHLLLLLNKYLESSNLTENQLQKISFILLINNLQKHMPSHAQSQICLQTHTTNTAM